MTFPSLTPSPLALQFEKWHGAHNDFLFIRRSDLQKAFGESLDTTLIGHMTASLTSRRAGVGADGVVVWDTVTGSASVCAGIWNSDGSRASTCGNALRCFGGLLNANGHWSGDHPLEVLTLEGDLGASSTFATLVSAACCDARDEFQASVDMGSVSEVSARTLEPLENEIRNLFGPERNGAPQAATFVQLANPNLVLHFSRGFLAAHSSAEIEKFGLFFQSEEVCRRLQIPVSNIGFIEIEANGADDSHLGVVFERGAGLTQCCGSGGCAMLLSFQHLSRKGNSEELKILMPGGTIRVSTGQNGKLMLSGPAKKVGEFQVSYWP